MKARDLARTGLVTATQATAIEARSGHDGVMDIDVLVGEGLLTSVQADAISRLQSSTTPSTQSARAPASPRGDATADPREEPTASVGRAASRPPRSRGRRLRPGPRGLGALLVVVAYVGLATTVLTLTTDALIAPQRLPGGDIEDLLHLVGQVAMMVGGLLYWRRSVAARRVALAGLLLNIAATTILSATRLADPVVLTLVAVWLLLATAVWRRHPAPTAEPVTGFA